MRLTLGLLLVFGPGCAAGKVSGGTAFALDFDGEKSCASANASSLASASALTVEAWVVGDADPVFADHPIIAWPGAFALWGDEDGVGWFTDGAGQQGASYTDGWMDGLPHHVAGTWDGSQTNLYVDGALVGFGPATLFTEPGDTLSVGCWGSDLRRHHGLIDEIRVSATVRYSADFEVPTRPYQLDDDTMALWHVDEGTADVALNEAGGADLALVDTRWVEFAVGADTVIDYVEDMP